ncbi:unnamed protein product (macronuclear) [Paramecium tetraurelia]|uniref:Uncharacterized protein n=1 Tax=Paramecium tetraurelia TaxID=5888 RepID=A0DQ38_PARTE|nr:uncharacterized protein GSPATT00002555001 [Paramecium tetraurelia]CAK85155.1 unnamed protein product [Paramecium tetraurelia]|eukprot:XP_001452552.1 hypothetical protein (macronuclear) [Paramecium tetraurelia strain d4-2]
MNQYDRIRPIVFQKASEVNYIRSNSSAVRSSPLRQKLDQSFDLQADSTKNQTNTTLKDISNYKKLYVSESCQNNSKENQLSGKNFSFRLEETSFLKQRIKQLETLNTNHISENKKLAHVLDQQIQQHQQLQEQYQQKNQIIRKIEDVQKANKYQLTSNTELKQLNEQLVMSKQVISNLEEKMQLILQDNQKLSQENDRFQFQDQQLKIQLDKYKSRCSILETKLKQTQDESQCLELQRKIKKQNEDIELLQRENNAMKEQLNQNNNIIQLQEKDKQPSQNVDKYRETIQELDCENKYLLKVIEIDQQKMKNLEEKLNLLTKENQRLTDIVKNRHKQ